MNFTPEQRLIVTLLCDLHKKLGINDSYDPDFISEAILSGNEWAIDSKYFSVSDIRPVSQELRDHVCEILDMCSMIEESYTSLPETDKDKVKSMTVYDASKAFYGFDGNNESEYMALARFMIDKMDMYSWFKGRSFNSHCHSIGAYKRMLSVFQKLGSRNLFSSPLSADEIAEVMNARIHPSHAKSHA